MLQIWNCIICLKSCRHIFIHHIVLKHLKQSADLVFLKKNVLEQEFLETNFSEQNRENFYETKRSEKESMINPYNSYILRHWRAHMDTQLICNAEGAAYCVCSYICKSGPDELKIALS